MWKNTNFVEESLTMIYLDYSRWLNVGRWWEFWSKCLQWWHVKIRWWVLEILRSWWLRNIDLFPWAFYNLFSIYYCSERIHCAFWKTIFYHYYEQTEKMKFHHKKTIIPAIYFLLFLLWMTLFINATEDMTHMIIQDLRNDIQDDVPLCLFSKCFFLLLFIAT